MSLRRVVGMGWARLLLGILAAAAAATSAIPAAVALLEGPRRGLAQVLGPWDEFLRGLLMLLPFGLVLTLAGGLPVHLALAALRRQGWLAYALGGALGGGGLVLALGGEAVAGAALGLVAALAFRAVWRPAAASAHEAPKR